MEPRTQICGPIPGAGGPDVFFLRAQALGVPVVRGDAAGLPGLLQPPRPGSRKLGNSGTHVSQHTQGGKAKLACPLVLFWAISGEKNNHLRNACPLEKHIGNLVSEFPLEKNWSFCPLGQILAISIPSCDKNRSFCPLGNIFVFSGKKV